MSCIKGVLYDKKYIVNLLIFKYLCEFFYKNNDE